MSLNTSLKLCGYSRSNALSRSNSTIPFPSHLSIAITHLCTIWFSAVSQEGLAQKLGWHSWLSQVTGYVCEVFAESVCNVFRFCDFMFTIPDDSWCFCYVPWTRFTQMRPQLLWISGVLFDDMLVEGHFRCLCLDPFGYLVLPHFIVVLSALCLSLYSMATMISPVSLLFALDVSLLHWPMCVKQTTKTLPCFQCIINISMLRNIWTWHLMKIMYKMICIKVFLLLICDCRGDSSLCWIVFA